jgi:serine/threonine-protein kinase
MNNLFDRGENFTTREEPLAGDGTAFGRYDLILPLGQGGMATVYVGQVSGIAGFEKLVALKVIHPHLSREKQFVQMFLDEARIAAQILHPNVAAVHEIGEHEGLLYMVGELVRGQSLKTVIRRAAAEGMPFTQSIIAHIGASICSGLHAAHGLVDSEGRRLNLVHRDVSPQNVLVSYTGHIKLIDFGVAHARGRLSHTESGTIKGKMGYVSPEQLLGRSLDCRSDLFSLGVVLYELVTGRHPFPGRTGMDRLHRIAKGKLKPPREVYPAISPDLERIILTALNRDPDGRYPDAAAMGEALTAFVRSQTEAAGPELLAKQMRYLFSADIAEQDRKLRGFRIKTGPSSVATGARAEGGTDWSRRVDSGERHAWTASGTAVVDPERGGRSIRAWLAGIAAVFAIATGLVALVAFGGDGDTDDSRVTNAAVSPARAAAQEQRAETSAPAAPAATKSRQGQGATNVKLTFSLNPADALIVLDGSKTIAGVEEIVLPADGKRHTLTCKAKGYKPQTVEIAVERDHLITFDLVRAPKKPRQKRKVIEETVLVPNPY